MCVICQNCGVRPAQKDNTCCHVCTRQLQLDRLYRKRARERLAEYNRNLEQLRHDEAICRKD